MAGKVNLIKDDTLRKLQDFDVLANKDQILVSKNGEKRVLEFANEKPFLYIANGFVAMSYIPLRPGPAV